MKDGHVDNKGQKVLEENKKEADYQWECRAPRSQDTKHKESIRRNVSVETPALTTLVSCDGLGGYDWSDQAEEGPNFALMAYTSLSSDSKNEQLIKDLKKSELMILGYKLGLDKFANKPIVKNCDAKTGETKPKDVRKNNYAPIIEEWVSDDEEEVTQPNIKLKIVKPSILKIEFVKPKQPEKKARKTIKQGTCPILQIMKKLMEDMLLLEVTPKEGKSLAKNSVLFNDTECIVLSQHFKLIDESQVLLRVLRKNNMYSVDLKNIVPKGGLNCLFAKTTSDESKLWHRRLGHLNCKTMNKLVKGNLVRGFPSKLFENVETYVACQKGKQHRASCKTKTKNSIDLPLHLLHMDLFGLTFVKSLMNKMYYLVATDDYSRFTWVFFLSTKDKTSGILKSFITRMKNLVDPKVKVIRCDSGTEFKNREINHFCKIKGILRQYSIARTPQQNGVAERRNRTLIEVARTIVLVVKPHNKTPYELFHGRTPALSFMKPFGCPVTILNTLDHLGKFDGKANEGFFIRYLMNSKVFRVFNSRTRIMEENLHIRFSKSTPNVVGCGPDCLFDIDALTRTMNYEPIAAGIQSNGFAGSECKDQEQEDNVNNTNNVNAASKNGVNTVSGDTSSELLFNSDMPALEDIGTFNFSSDHEDDDEEADMNNMDTTIQRAGTELEQESSKKQKIDDDKEGAELKQLVKIIPDEEGVAINVIPLAIKPPSIVD
nr:putative ribonuclease H-like domain-containing protein [Tanacetum cinerariifolium]